MFVDKNTLLSGGDGVAQTLATSTTSDYSDDYVDLKSAFPALASGQSLVLRCIPTTDFGAAFGTKVRLELRAFPVLQSAVTLTGCTINTTTDVLTKAGHGFSNGQHLRISTLATSSLSGGSATTRDFFAVNVTDDTFQLADELNGTPLDFTGSNGTATVVIQHEVLGSTGDIPLGRFVAANPEDGALATGIVTCSTNPVTQTAPSCRYVYAYVEASNNITGGACYFHLAHDSGEGSAPFVFHRSGFTVE